MKYNYTAIWLVALLIVIVFIQCRHEPIIDPEPPGTAYDPTPFIVNQKPGLPPFPYPTSNPMTVQGVNLGRHLFYDPALSADSTLACAGCHKIEHAFSDGGVAFSIGVDGLPGKRNAMNIFNLGYVPFSIETGGEVPFFWDGRATNIEDQVHFPIEDVLEMHALMPDVITKLERREEYVTWFYEAFGTTEITQELIQDAIAQFERSIVSAYTKFDSAIILNQGFLDEDALAGYNLFNDLHGGDCFHCHGINSGLFTDYQFRDNGLDSVTRYFDFADAGRGAITGDTADYGKFKVPTLRNVELTPPYMHDGRFATLEEVLDFYSEHVHKTQFTDPFMQFADSGGAHLSDLEKYQIIEFLKTLTDHSLATDTSYSNPW